MGHTRRSALEVQVRALESTFHADWVDAVTGDPARRAAMCAMALDELKENRRSAEGEVKFLQQSLALLVSAGAPQPVVDLVTHQIDLATAALQEVIALQQEVENAC